MKDDLVLKYVHNELSPEERYAFELEMENDPFLMESVEGLQQFAATHTISQLQQVQHDLFTSINQKTTTKKASIKKINPFLLWAFAACFIGLIVTVSWHFILQGNTPNTDQLFAAYYQPLTHPDGTVRGEDNKHSEKDAIALYEKEDYFEAANLYQKLVNNNPENIKNRLFLGISYLSSNQTEKAIVVLSGIQQATEYQQDIQWYLALAYIKNKNVTAAIPLLHALSESPNYYQPKAKELVEKFDGKMASKD